MNSVFDKLNLRPQERRLVVITGIVIFVMFNFWQVFPMFGEYGKNLNRIDAARQTLKKYEDEIARRESYLKQVSDLENQGQTVATEEAALTLSSEINSQAILSGVTLTSVTPMTRQPSSSGKTNLFFEEATVNISVNTGEKELIDFLYRLADKSMLIRAKSMTLGTDPSQMRLQGPITLVKSYQRRPPPKAASSATKTATPSPTTKPATTPPPASPSTVAPSQPPPVLPPPAPAPTPSGGTNRGRRALPTPVKL
jgi:hypothetical protein